MSPDDLTNHLLRQVLERLDTLAALLKPVEVKPVETKAKRK